MEDLRNFKKNADNMGMIGKVVSFRGDKKDLFMEFVVSDPDRYSILGGFFRVDLLDLEMDSDEYLADMMDNLADMNDSWIIVCKSMGVDINIKRFSALVCRDDVSFNRAMEEIFK